jgi:SAM-dependent methyltransferase
MTMGPPLAAADAAHFENAVAPRYLSFFTSLLIDMMLPYEPARIANVGCRNGYPDALVAEKMAGATLVGIDNSPAAVELARTKASLLSGAQASYTHGDGLPTPLPDSGFTHAFALHPICRPSQRAGLMAELRRLLVPGGQALVALPLRGSFPEISDMGRECALKQDLTELGVALDAAAASRPTIETIAAELTAVGLTEVDVDVQLIAVSFNSGREFLEHPIARLMVFPEATALVEAEPPVIDALVRYINHAISKYWSEGMFELTVNVGCASARRY